MAESRASGDPVTSMTLVGRLKLQDPSAWRQLAELYGPLVYSWVRISGLNEHDAADVVQEVFSTVHASLDRFRKERPTDRFRDWLWTITRRRTCDHLRKLGKQVIAKGGSDAYQQLQEFPEEISSADDPQAASAEAELVRRALDLVRREFEDRTWQACLQTAVNGRNPADVAADLGMSVGALYVARSRVLKRLRQELGDVL
jgi:RNA polymerase sigma-70 factor (ECF subfamily)